MYVVTRRDLSPGLQATQAAHAALKFSVQYPDLTRRWEEDSNFLIILSVEDETALLRLVEKAESQGIRCIRFHEPDLDNEMTAIALEPSEASQRLCSSLPLALRDESRELVAV